MNRLVLFATLFCLSGCYTTKLYYGSQAGSAGSTHVRFQHTFLWGFLSPGATDLSRVCNNLPVVAVQSQVAGLGLIANWLTAGIWVPMTVTVTCAQPPRATIFEDPTVYPELTDGVVDAE